MEFSPSPKWQAFFRSKADVSYDPVTSGTLRIARTGTQITTYFNGVEHITVEAFIGSVIVSMGLDGPLTGSSVVYDNFLINSGTLTGPALECPDGNQPPIANAGVDIISPDCSAVVNLDGSLSSDPDGDVLS
jgi:hypothetical protein